MNLQDYYTSEEVMQMAGLKLKQSFAKWRKDKGLKVGVSVARRKFYLKTDVAKIIGEEDLIEHDAQQLKKRDINLKEYTSPALAIREGIWGASRQRLYKLSRHFNSSSSGIVQDPPIGYIDVNLDGTSFCLFNVQDMEMWASL